jgi:hypothetical protein
MTPIEKLRKMVNKSWMYNTKLYFFEDVRENSAGRVTLHTDRFNMNFDEEKELVKFLQEVLPVEDKPAPATNPIQPAIDNDVARQLQQILMDNIERIQQSKHYIPQAMAISKQVNTLINLTNLELKIKNRQ